VPVGSAAGRAVEQRPVAAGGERSELGGEHGTGRTVAVAVVGVVGQGAGEVGEQRRGPDPGPRVGGDADCGVGGDDAAVQRSPGIRTQRRAKQNRDQRVDEQRPAGQRVTSRLPGGGPGQVEGVEPHTGFAEADEGAADRGGEPVYSFSGSTTATSMPAYSERRTSSLAR